VSAIHFKRTKIIATVGPATNSYEAIYDLIKAGANVLRLNCSHGTNDERSKQIEWIRAASEAYGKPVAILLDLQSPKIRLGDFEGVFPVEAGQHLRFKYKANLQSDGIIPMQYDISKKVQRGERLLLYDGKIRTEITNVRDGIVYARAESEGVLIKRKGMNLPDTNFDGDIITKKDRQDLAFGSIADIDYVAMSFIQTAHDVKSIRRIMKGLGMVDRKIIAKIETVSALEHIDSIVDEADAVMIARGDLATETGPELVPIEQRRIVGLCRRKGKPVIVATQMLATMTESLEPTRAEVSDVATAVLIGSDSVMLSEETAAGRYPTEAVKIMKKVITYAEQNSPHDVIINSYDDSLGSRHSAVCSAAIILANEIGATAIVAETKSGATALQLASRRPHHPIIAVTSDKRVAQQLCLVYGIKSFVRPDSKYAADKLTTWLVKQKIFEKGDVVVSASGKYPGKVGTTDTIKVRVLD